MKLAMTGLIVLALCCGTVGLIGCGGGDTDSADSKVEKPSAKKSAPPQPAKRVVEVETKAGEKVDVQISTTGAEGKDQGIPVFPGATAAAAMWIPGEASMSSYTTDTSAGDVFEYYVEELEAQGWSITKKNEDKLSIKATKGDKKASFKINGTRGGTEIAVILEGA